MKSVGFRGKRDELRGWVGDWVATLTEDEGVLDQSFMCEMRRVSFFGGRVLLDWGK